MAIVSDSYIFIYINVVKIFSKIRSSEVLILKMILTLFINVYIYCR